MHTFMFQAGFVPSVGVTVNGTIAVNGGAVPPAMMRRISGFVHQDDVILHTMTVSMKGGRL